MASPVDNSYSAASGVTIRAGISVASFPVLTRGIVFGDSLTALTYNAAGYRWGYPLTNSPPLIIHNAGFASDTLDLMDARIYTDVISYAPQFVAMRAGTNSLGLSSAAFQSKYRGLIDKMLAAGIVVVCHQIPPKAGVSGSLIAALNIWIAGQCAADPTRLKYVADCNRVADSNYDLLAQYFVDGIHFNGLGCFTIGEDMAAAYSPYLLTVSPLVTSATAAAQWVSNPFNAGNAGTMYYATGTVANGWGVNCGGVSTNSALCSIIAADVGDENQTPWQRIELINGVANGGTGAACTIANPAIAADLTVKRIDTMVEVRTVNLDMTHVNSISLGLSRSGVAVMPDLKMAAVGGIGVINKRMVMRNSFQRDEGTSGLVSPVAYPANSISLGISVAFETSFTSSIGFIDIRRASAQGMAS